MLLIPIATVLSFLIAGVISRLVIVKIFGRLAAKTVTQLDDILVAVFGKVVVYWAILFGLHVALHNAPFADYIRNYINPILWAIFVLTLSYALARILTDVIKLKSTPNGHTIAATSITKKIIQIGIYILGGVTILNIFGVSVTPILTALGVGGLAVALALQDTLTNFFAGIYITIADQIRVGDFVKIADGVEGFISDIGWRNTCIKGVDENLIIMPNIKLSQATVTNFHLPESLSKIKISVNVSHENDPNIVEQTLKSIVSEAGNSSLEIASKEIQAEGKIRGLMTEPPVIVRLNSFTETALEFSLICSVSRFEFRGNIQHELMKKIFSCFQNEKITLATSIRMVYVRETDKIF